jgi:hypothetical protein
MDNDSRLYVLAEAISDTFFSLFLQVKSQFHQMESQIKTMQTLMEASGIKLKDGEVPEPSRVNSDFMNELKKIDKP